MCSDENDQVGEFEIVENIEDTPSVGTACMVLSVVDTRKATSICLDRCASSILGRVWNDQTPRSQLAPIDPQFLTGFC